MITLGESAINIGDIAVDGGMGTSLLPLGKTFRDTCAVSMADPEETELFSEENDDPEFVVTRGGKINVNFSIMNPDVDTLVATLGGTKTGTGDTAVWNAPANLPNIEKSCEIIPKQGLKFSIPRLKMSCKIDWSNVGTTPLVIAVVGTVLIPAKEGEPKIKAQKYVPVTPEP
jgi:hypothetical protein